MTLPETDPSRRSFLALVAATGGGLMACAAEEGEATGEASAADTARACQLTSRDAEGPFFEPGAPVRRQIASAREPGTRLVIDGLLTRADCTTPLSGYIVDIWQADEAGNYYSGDATYRLRGKVVTDVDGRFAVESIVPGHYADDQGRFRPAHLHLKVSVSVRGRVRELLTTQVYFAGDPHLGDNDFCHRAGTCNSGDPGRIIALSDAVLGGQAGKRGALHLVLGVNGA